MRFGRLTDNIANGTDEILCCWLDRADCTMMNVQEGRGREGGEISIKTRGGIATNSNFYGNRAVSLISLVCCFAMNCGGDVFQYPMNITSINILYFLLSATMILFIGVTSIGIVAQST